MGSLRMPAEHGAWGILLVPFVCAAALASAWNIPLLLAAVCALSLFLLRGSVETQGGDSNLLLLPAHLALGVAAAVSGTLLVFFYQRYLLLVLGHGAGALYALQRRLARNDSSGRKGKRSLPAELIGVVLLTLAAPAAWISSVGRFDAAGAQVWLLNLLFFVGGVLYVKYRVRGIAAHRTFRDLGEKLVFAWPVILYHLLVLGFLACWVFLKSVPLAVILAFVPGVLRASGLLLNLGRRFPIRRLGWTEVAHSLIFATLLILTFRV